jgi:glycosyltransferase involved in cell wall biosynthesis
MVVQSSLFSRFEKAIEISEMKVCIISPIFHPLIGGPGGQARMMARELISKGMDVFVISRRLSGIDVEVEGIEVHYVSTFSPHVHNLSKFTIRNFLISISFTLSAMIKMMKLKKRFEIAQFYGASLPLLICLPLLKILNKKVVAKTTGGRGGKEAGGLDDFFLKPLMIGVFKYTDKFITVNNDIRLRLHNEGFAEDKIMHIPNGVDVNIFYPYELEKRDKRRKDFGLADKKIVVYCGRLTEGKGLEILLEAMKVIIKHDKNAYLIILGDGPLKSKLIDTAVYLGISDNVKFKGNVE